MRKRFCLFYSTMLEKLTLKLLLTSKIPLIPLIASSALERAKQQDVKSEPDFSYLQNLKIAVSIIHLLSAYINTALIPLASSSLTVRREMVNYTSMNIGNLEKKVNSIFQITHESKMPSS
jgi:hypothetical protein